MSQVFGNNQPRTRYFRDILSKEKVIIQVSPEKKSNIVHTVTIKDAIMKCLDHEYIPGIYSLVNNPQWTWKDVIDYYKSKWTGKKYDYFFYTKIINRKKYYFSTALKNPNRIISKSQRYKHNNITKENT